MGASQAAPARQCTHYQWEWTIDGISDEPVDARSFRNAIHDGHERIIGTHQHSETDKTAFRGSKTEPPSKQRQIGFQYGVEAHLPSGWLDRFKRGLQPQDRSLPFLGRNIASHVYS